MTTNQLSKLQRRVSRPTSPTAPPQLGEAPLAMGGGLAIPLPPPVGPLRRWSHHTSYQQGIYKGFLKIRRSIVFSPGGKTLAIKLAETPTGVLWDVDAGQGRSIFTNAAAGLAYTPEGSTLTVPGGAEDDVFLNNPLAVASMSGSLSTNPN